MGSGRNHQVRRSKKGIIERMESNRIRPDKNTPSSQEMPTAPPSQEEAERRARIEYLRSLTGPPKPNIVWTHIAKIVAIVLAIGLVGGAVYWFVLKKPASKSSGTQSTHTTESKKRQPSDDQAGTTFTTKHHDSTQFALGFDYPESWSITTDEGGTLVAKSDVMNLTTSQGQQKGQVVLTIQSKQTSLPQFQKGNGVAVRESEKLTYLKPTPNQRAQTYLSFVSYAGSATNGISALYVTGDIGYMVGQAVPEVDIVRVDPLISVSFQACDSANGCKEGVPLAVSPASWKEGGALAKHVKTILTSLAIQ